MTHYVNSPNVVLLCAAVSSLLSRSASATDIKLAFSASSQPSSSSPGATLASILRLRQSDGEAEELGGCWATTLQQTKQSCVDLDSTRQAALALRYLNCQLHQLGLPEIRCPDLDKCATFKEISKSAWLLPVLVQFHVQVMSTCAFQELHNQQKRVVKVARQIAEAIDGISADIRQLLIVGQKVKLFEDRIGLLQNQTLMKQTRIKRMVESDHMVRIYETIEEMRVFLTSTYYSAQFSIESFILLVISLALTYPSSLRFARGHLAGLVGLKLFIERQIIYSLLRHNKSIDGSLTNVQIFSRTVFLLGAMLLLTKGNKATESKVTSRDIENSIRQLEVELIMLHSNRPLNLATEWLLI